MGTLIIGIGNPLRRDDGAGPLVAASDWSMVEVEAVAVHQLVPELAEAIARADRVVFVDAAVGPDQGVAWRRLDPSVAWELGHALDPAGLLGLAAVLYDRVPDAFLLTVPGEDFSHGEGLSATASRHCERARETLRSWLAAR